MSLPQKNLKISLVQMISGPVTDANVVEVKKALDDVVPFAPDLVSFPENVFHFRVQKDAPLQAVSLQEPFWQDLTAWCAKTGAAVHIGGTPTLIDDRVHNATIWITEKGPEVLYSKIHLFDVDVQGQPPVRESDSFQGGDRPRLVEWHGWKIGLSICYDLRFAELYNVYGKAGAHLLLVPSAFLVPTGQAHWQVLLRARAIENQAFVAAAAQAGRHTLPDRAEPFRDTYGHSLVVGPWGDVLAEASANRREILNCELPVESLKAMRTQIPMAGHRRL